MEGWTTTITFFVYNCYNCKNMIERFLTNMKILYTNKSNVVRFFISLYSVFHRTIKIIFLVIPNFIISEVVKL